MLKLELVPYQDEYILYTEGVPAFVLHSDGEKEWIVPDGAVMYMNNKEFVDEWLKNQKIVSATLM